MHKQNPPAEALPPTRQALLLSFAADCLAATALYNFKRSEADDPIYWPNMESMAMHASRTQKIG
jgi:hypothetical protein